MIAKIPQIINFVSAKNLIRPSKGKAEGGCGGNSALPLQKIEASPAPFRGKNRSRAKSEM